MAALGNMTYALVLLNVIFAGNLSMGQGASANEDHSPWNGYESLFSRGIHDVLYVFPYGLNIPIWYKGLYLGGSYVEGA